MTPEGKVKKKVTTLLKELGVYYFFPMTGGYGASGVPDIVACARGHFMGIECKAGENLPTPLQQSNLLKISAAGGTTFVVNEVTFPNFEDFMRKTYGKPAPS